MKITHLFIWATLGTALLGSCSSDEAVEEVVEEQSISKQIVMMASDFINTSESRTSISTDYTFSWAKNDTVGVFANQGGQVCFPMINGAGTNTASFNGGGWALKQSSNYMAYYPMKGEFYLDKTAVPVSFLGQKQIGKNSTAHLGKYDYMAANSTTPVEGKVNFNFKHLVSLIEVDVTVPNAGDLSTVKLSADEPCFITRGTVDLTSQTPKIMSFEASKSVTVSLENVTVASDNTEVVKVYFMMAPVDLTGKTIKVSVLNNGKIYYTTKVFKNIEAGKFYKVIVKDWKVPALPSTVKWVDLGLSVKWASHNVGATKPEEYGEHFAWGEIMLKDVYIRDNSLTYGQSMGSIAGDARYDAATANWGTSARTPTQAEFKELVDNTTWQWTAQNGVNGMQITSKTTGNSIFLPAAGCWRESSFIDAGNHAYYWSATPNEKSTNSTYNLMFDSANLSWSGRYYRFLGLSVRPVCK